MEFCEGGSLEFLSHKVRENGWRVGEKILAKIAESVRATTPPRSSARRPLLTMSARLQILSGLSYLHSRKIIHRGELVLV